MSSHASSTDRGGHHTLNPASMYSARLRKLYQIKAITGETNVPLDDDDDDDDNESSTRRRRGEDGGDDDYHNRLDDRDRQGSVSFGDDSGDNNSSSPSAGRARGGAVGKKGEVLAPAAMKNLHKHIQRRRKLRYERQVRLLRMERSMLPSQISNDPDNSKILEDVIRRQNNTLAVRGAGVGVGGRRRRGAGRGGSADDDDDSDNDSSDDSDNDNDSDGNIDDQQQERQQRELRALSPLGASSSYGGASSSGGSPPLSPIRGPQNSPTKRGKDNKDDLLPNIMRGRNVDLTKVAEQAQLAAQQLMDTQKSLAKDTRFLLMGAVHNSHDAVRKFHALYTHGDCAQPNPPLPELPRVEETHSHRARGGTCATTTNTNTAASTARTAATGSRGGGGGGSGRSTTAQQKQQQQGTGAVAATEGRGESKRAQPPAPAGSSVNAIEDEKRRAINFLFMTEVSDPEMDSLQLPPRETTTFNKPHPPLTSNNGSGEQHAQQHAHTGRVGGAGAGRRSSRISNASASGFSVSSSASASLAASNNPDRSSSPMRLYTGELLFPASPTTPQTKPLHYHGSGGGDNNHNALVALGGGNNNNNNNNGGQHSPSKRVTIDDLLSFDRKKNIDKHHQSYRCIPTEDQPKFPHLTKPLGASKKIRKFTNKVNKSAVEFGRHGLVELRRAWEAQQDFRHERKKVMNELLEDRHLQFTAPQRVLHTVRMRMKTAAFAKDHNERLNYFFEHINNVRPFIDELFPQQQQRRQAYQIPSAIIGGGSLFLDDGSATTTTAGGDTTAGGGGGGGGGDDTTASSTTPPESPTAAAATNASFAEVHRRIQKQFGKLDGRAMAHDFLDELHNTIIQYDGVTSLAQLDEVFEKSWDYEHIHLEHVVNLLALVAPLFGASEEEFSEWVRLKRQRHEGRDKAVVVQVAKTSISTTSTIDAHFTLSVHSVKGVWRMGVGAVNRTKAYVRFFAENKPLVATPRAVLRNCKWDDAVYNINLQDHNSVIYISLIADNEVEVATGTLAVNSVPWKRVTSMTVPLRGQMVDGCSLNLSVEMDFPQVLGPAMRRKINANSTVPIEMANAKTIAAGNNDTGNNKEASSSPSRIR